MTEDFCWFCDGDGRYSILHVETDDQGHIIATWNVQEECVICNGHGLIDTES